MHQFTCHPFAEKPHFAEEMAKVAQTLWGDVAPNWGLDDWKADFAGLVTKSRIEQTFVAADAKGDFAGMAGLTSYDMHTRKDLFGWLASVYIKPQHRGLGLGTWLVAQVEAQAVAEGLKLLHLYTPDAAEFYARIGWQVLEETTYKGKPVTIMRKDFAAILAPKENNILPFKQKK